MIKAKDIWTGEISYYDPSEWHKCLGHYFDNSMTTSQLSIRKYKKCRETSLFTHLKSIDGDKKNTSRR